jgi:hypothetical protein
MMFFEGSLSSFCTLDLKHLAVSYACVDSSLDIGITSCTSSNYQEGFDCSEAFDGITTGRENGWAYDAVVPAWGEFMFEEPSAVNRLTILSGVHRSTFHIQDFAIECKVGNQFFDVTNVKLSSGQDAEIDGNRITLEAGHESLDVVFDTVPNCIGVKIRVFSTDAPNENIVLTELTVHGSAPSEEFKYVGCYVDDEQRDLGGLIVGRTHTPESCSNLCYQYPYFALQDGGWCVCGNSYATEAKYSKVGDGECGSAGTGAAWRNSVYEHAYEINYHVANSQMNLPTARSYCYSKGGFLAKPRNEADRNFIRALLPSGNVRAWLGIHQTNGMTWLRDSGDSMGWTNWKSGEGNDRRGVNAGAAMVWQSGWSGEWYDMPNNDGRLHYVVCELPGSSDLANVDYSTCQWHEINQWKKEIHSDDGIPDNFFGFECPPNQIIADLRLQRIDESHLHNDPIAIYCCELGGHGVVTDTCIDRWASETDDGFETAICEGNSAMVAVFDVIDEQTMPDLPQTEWQYSHTKGVTCCDVKYNTAHGIKNDFGINRSDCALISAEKDEDEFDVRCPEDMVLVGVEDHHDLLPGVQGMYSIECCGLHDFAAPTQAPSTSEPSKAPTPSPTDSPTTSPSKSPTPSPTQAPITSEPSLSPTTSCDDCLDKVHAKEIADPSCFRREVQACLDLCCVMEY